MPAAQIVRSGAAPHSPLRPGPPTISADRARQAPGRLITKRDRQRSEPVTGISPARRVTYRLMDRSPSAGGLSMQPAGRLPARSAVDADAVSDSAGESRGDLLDQPRIAVGIIEGAERP